MQILTPCRETLGRKLAQPAWHLDPELALFDTILLLHPEITDLIKEEILGLGKQTGLGRQDSPTVEQILRAAIYKEVKGLTYPELEYHQYDSKVAAVFLQLTRPFSDSTWQKYIAVISAASLAQVLVRVNQIALEEGLEDLQKVRMDTTVVETDIHYPTNSSLLWDGIRTSTRILRQFDAKWVRRHTRDYRRQAKKQAFQIAVTRDKRRRKELFRKQLQVAGRCIAQIRAMLLYLERRTLPLSEADRRRVAYLQDFLPHFQTIEQVAYRREILEEAVPAQDKLFSLYETHTQMIVKGKDRVYFGRKVSLASGRSHLILHVRVCEGETDGQTFEPTLQDLITTYQRIPRDVATDGAYASGPNQQAAQKLGITNIVFNKLVGSLHNIASSLQMETRLKKWRSGIEGVISTVKRAFDLRRCRWKGDAHFQAKVFWSVIAYNLRVMGQLLVRKCAPVVG
jgi:IS5 family transposase